MATLHERTGVTFALPDDALAALGGLTATYSTAELLAAAAVWHALSLPAYEGTILTATMSLKQRLDLVLTLGPRGKITNANLVAIGAINTAFTKDGGLTQRRNQLIHAVWAERMGEEAIIVAPISFARSGKPTFGEAVTSADIEKTIKDISQQVSKLTNIVMESWGVDFSFQRPEALPEK